MNEKTGTGFESAFESNPRSEQELKDLIEEVKAERSDWYPIIFNNFHANLPGGYRRALGDDPEIADSYFWQKNPNVSEKKKNQTWREYYETIDEAVSQLNIDAVKATSLVEQKNLEELSELLSPLYIHLINMGYNRFDLIS